MRILPGLMLGALSLSACVRTVAPEPVEREVGGGGSCDADAAQRYVGQRATAELGANIRLATGAGIFQWVGPDTAVTMDFRPDRVRVSYDRQLIVTRIACG